MKNLLKSVVLASGILLASNAVNAQQKIGHINTAEIVQSTNEFKAAEAQMKTLSETKQKEIQDMIGKYQEQQNTANEKIRNRSEANKAAVDAELQTIGNTMREMETRIQGVQQAAQEEIGKKQQELYAPIEQKVMTAINTVAKEKGYAYVLDISSGSVPYFQGGDDLTADIKAKLGVSAAPAAKK
ncbi:MULTISPECIES: OmpH family outer membrane protein [Bacteroidota]|uniref:Outer membrane protein n=1 Tax=Sphingobacterium lactis TaxID=797291 RepID=A0A1H6B578_9SPHI|nr:MULTISPECIES: OmpH family outer membrane protein [Bacteroidota]SEG55704.1 outer membrane protein [Sphingobacterium lactis]